MKKFVLIAAMLMGMPYTAIAQKQGTWDNQLGCMSNGDIVPDELCKRPAKVQTKAKDQTKEKAWAALEIARVKALAAGDAYDEVVNGYSMTDEYSHGGSLNTSPTVKASYQATVVTLAAFNAAKADYSKQYGAPYQQQVTKTTTRQSSPQCTMLDNMIDRAANSGMPDNVRARQIETFMRNKDQAGCP
jgi:hypothetical protein